MNRKILCLGMIAVLMIAVCGCGNDSKGTKKKTETTEETSTVSREEDVEEETEETTNEQDTSGVELEDIFESIEQEETPVTGQAVIDIPEGFKEYLAPSGIYVTANYPKDGSNIYILTAPLYGELPDETAYKSKINANLSAQVGEKVEINLTEYGETTVEGCDAIRAVYTYSHDGMNFTRLEYTVNTDITTVIAFTQEGDADWMDVYEESALTMRIE